MGRNKMSEEEKQRAEEFRKTPDGIKQTLSRLKEREAQLLADLALREHPELEEHLVVLIELLKEVGAAETLRDRAREAEERYSIAVGNLKSGVDRVRPYFAEHGVEVETVLPQLRGVDFDV
jgi:hypothetical protein